jgi:DNA-binding XRE family transcriptional regulator
MTLKDLRESKEYTQTELAAGCGVTSQAVYAWERGEYEPSFIKVRAMAKFLGVTVEEVRQAIQETKNSKSS